MLHDPRLLDALEALSLEDGWSGQVWRQTIGTREPLRPNSRGARWNPAGTDALYCSLSESGARAEVANLVNRQPVATSKPLSMSRLEIKLGRVVDLWSARSLDDLGLDEAALTAEDWSAAQAVGGATSWLGFAGMLTPSARHTDRNLVIFVNNLQPDDVVTVVAAS